MTRSHTLITTRTYNSSMWRGAFVRETVGCVTGCSLKRKIKMVTDTRFTQAYPATVISKMVKAHPRNVNPPLSPRPHTYFLYLCTPQCTVRFYTTLKYNPAMLERYIVSRKVFSRTIYGTIASGRRCTLSPPAATSNRRPKKHTHARLYQSPFPLANPTRPKDR